jgi:hypothetical protein
MSLTKFSLVEKNLIIPGHGESLISDIPAGEGKSLTFFYSVIANNGKTSTCRSERRKTNRKGER